MAKAKDDKAAIKLDGQTKTTTLNNVHVAHPLVYKALQGCADNDARVDLAGQMMAIGALAIEQGRVLTLLNSVKGQVANELAQLQAYWDIEQLRSQTPQVGSLAESRILDTLTNLLCNRKYEDQIQVTGTVAAKGGNKTGDLVAVVKGKDIPSGIQPLVVIESKLDKAISYGDPLSRSPEAKQETVLSQLLEAKSSRQAHEAIIVLDRDRAKDDLIERVGFVHYEVGYGFICLISWGKQDFAALEAAYPLARAQAIRAATDGQSPRNGTLERAVIRLLLGKLNQDLSYLSGIAKAVAGARKELSGIIESVETHRKMVEHDSRQIEAVFSRGVATADDLFDLLENTSLKQELPLLRAKLEADEQQEIELAGCRRDVA